MLARLSGKDVAANDQRNPMPLGVGFFLPQVAEMMKVVC